jgi:hypothetical protein
MISDSRSCRNLAGTVSFPVDFSQKPARTGGWGNIRKYGSSILVGNSPYRNLLILNVSHQQHTKELSRAQPKTFLYSIKVFKDLQKPSLILKKFDRKRFSEDPKHLNKALVLWVLSLHIPCNYRREIFKDFSDFEKVLSRIVSLMNLNVFKLIDIRVMIKIIIKKIT